MLKYTSWLLLKTDLILMTRLWINFILLFLFIAITSCGQTQKKTVLKGYTLDNKIKQEVDKKVESFLGRTTSKIDFKMYENDSLIVDSYSNGKSFDCITMTTLEGDTANIVGFIGMSAALGFRISLFKDTCIVSYFESTDAIDTTHLSDSSLFTGTINCKNYKLTLANKPKKGEKIEGVIELTTDNYYQTKNGKKSKNKMYLKSYFSTEILQTLQELSEQLNKKAK